MTEERKIFLRDNYLRTLERVENSCIRCGRKKPVTLLAASKTYPAEDIEFLAKCGLNLCGENYVQEFVEKHDSVTASGVRMDLIGHLQTNKVKYVAGKAGLIHSVDSLKLASEINKFCLKNGTTQDFLIEVNIGMEETKNGITPLEFDEFAEAVSGFEAIHLRGMMTMAPKCQEKEDFRKYFRESYKIFLDFFGKKTHNIVDPVLSMGMSDSFEIAIEEGADIVRVGSAIFGARVYH